MDSIGCRPCSDDDFDCQVGCVPHGIGLVAGLGPSKLLVAPHCRTSHVGSVLLETRFDSFRVSSCTKALSTSFYTPWYCWAPSCVCSPVGHWIKAALGGVE
mmetsp:Transcript_21243/g.56778  ORF Transcript_21243/g.56778 Transcript_21243/m.56778 type:complete len:101 (-) Transcript_21243:269-571(-)